MHFCSFQFNVGNFRKRKCQMAVRQVVVLIPHPILHVHRFPHMVDVTRNSRLCHRGITEKDPLKMLLLKKMRRLNLPKILMTLPQQRIHNSDFNRWKFISSLPLYLYFTVFFMYVASCVTILLLHHNCHFVFSFSFPFLSQQCSFSESNLKGPTKRCIYVND